jgi:hypothetical protein
MSQRRLLKQITSLEDRFAEEAKRLKAAADKARDIREREILLRKARQAETAARVKKWLSSPGLQPPK